MYSHRRAQPVHYRSYYQRRIDPIFDPHVFYPHVFDLSSMVDQYRSTDSERRILGEGQSRLPDDEVYLEKVQKILTGSPFIGVPPDPTAVYHHVYIGTQANAENLALLKRMRFTHVLNCAGLPTSLYHARARRYTDETGIRYEELPIDDNEDFDFYHYLNRAHAFINSAEFTGRVLVHCTGVSRSGAVVISYIISRGTRLFEAVRMVKNCRRVALCNTGFMLQLVQYARHLNLLDVEPGLADTPMYQAVVPKYYRRVDRARVMSAHLPTFV